MKPAQFELFCNFIVRHGRFLKKSETSFTLKELDSGIKLAIKAVRAVQSACRKMPPDEFRGCIGSSVKSKKIARVIRSKVKQITQKQAQVIVENFEKFLSAMNALQSQSQGAQSVKTKKESTFGDRFYSPKEHKYR